MTNRIKLSILGGSALSTPLLFDAMGRMGAENAYSVSLFGQNHQKLNLVKNFSYAIAAGYPNLDIEFETTTEAAEAIDGSDYILNQIRVGGLKGRLFDETFSRSMGIPGEETVGPGGFSSSVRGIPIVLDYCRLIENYAPDAVLLNLTNPSSIIQYAIQNYTHVKVLGTCDTPISTIEMVANSLGIAADELLFEWFGMHHFGWVTQIWNGEKPLIGEAIRNYDKMPSLGVDSEIIEAIGAIPVSYLKYYFHPDRILAATERRTPRAQELIELFDQMQKEMESWMPGEPFTALKKRGAGWYSKIVVPTLLALSEKRTTELILSIQNQGSIAWLPENAIIELPVPIVNGEVGKPRVPHKIPFDIQGMVTRNSAYEMLAAEAIVEQDRGKALRALQSNLLISNFNQVRGIMEKVWPDEDNYHFVRIDYPQTTTRYVREKELGFAVPSLHYGEELLESIELPEERFAVITMEVPWRQVENRLMSLPKAAIFVDELDWYKLEAMERSLPDIDAIIGLGGGMAIDAAKYVAWKRHIPMDAVPTITSVDACVTKSIAARIGGNVTYIGYLVPRNVYIDYRVIMAAPKRLNRSGVGDILCAHAALFDWKLAHEHNGERYDIAAVEKMQAWLNRIDTHAQHICDVDSTGVRLIMEAFEDISIICRQFGNSRPQEGSDHTFAYNAEYQTGRNFLHGELVALGAYVMVRLQKNCPENLKSVYQKTGILWQPGEIGLSKPEFRKILETLNSYQKSFGRRYTILNEENIEVQFIEQLIEELQF